MDIPQARKPSLRKPPRLHARVPAHLQLQRADGSGTPLRLDTPNQGLRITETVDMPIIEVEHDRPAPAMPEWPGDFQFRRCGKRDDGTPDYDYRRAIDPKVIG